MQILTLFISLLAIGNGAAALAQKAGEMPKVTCFLSWNTRNADGTTGDVKNSKVEEVTDQEDTKIELKGFTAVAKLATGGALNRGRPALGLPGLPKPGGVPPVEGPAKQGPPRNWELTVELSHDKTKAFYTRPVEGRSRHSLSMEVGRDSATLLCDPK